MSIEEAADRLANYPSRGLARAAAAMEERERGQVRGSAWRSALERMDGRKRLMEGLDDRVGVDDEALRDAASEQADALRSVMRNLHPADKEASVLQGVLDFLSKLAGTSVGGKIDEGRRPAPRARGQVRLQEGRQSRGGPDVSRWQH